MADEPKLPTEDDIRQLPRWARVAFAARCARRVLPLFQSHRPGPGAPDEHTSSVVVAIEAVEQVAARAPSSAPARVAVIYAAAAAARATHAAAYAAPRGGAARAARAARAAAATAHATAVAADAPPDAPRARNAARAVAYAAAAGAHAARAAAYGHRSIDRSIGQDFIKLKNAARAGGWTDNTPVPPEVFGPLWPDGRPNRWPDDPVDDDFNFVLRAVAKPGVPFGTVRKHAFELFQAFNEYSLAKYGRRLRVKNFRRLVAEHTRKRV